ncbi:metal ABC transporter ATP-binding protein [Paracoccus niistensis]|uniref:Metal ABC transporter ATP-binding protein n=1 Tax=Paracoccus niistensis TaxID=632935 RepID=A0ABV6I5U7_9RHOB
MPGRRVTGGGAPLVTLAGVSVALGGQSILSGIDLSIRRGEIVTVVGPNGSGKTTLMRTIIGAVPPTAGRITRAPGLRLSYVPQRLAIDPTMPMTLAGFMNLPRRRDAAVVASALERAGLAGLQARPLAALSGGQMQRALLARALLNDPDLLILDEGTAGLDQPGVASFYERIEQVNRDTGCAVLMVSHDLQVVMRASDHVICLNGHICCEGTPESVSLSPAYLGLFGGAGGALALYRHHHTHSHDDGQPCAGHTHEDAA